MGGWGGGVAVRDFSHPQEASGPAGLFANRSRQLKPADRFVFSCLVMLWQACRCKVERWDDDLCMRGCADSAGLILFPCCACCRLNCMDHLQEYSAAFLGMENAAYCAWITNPAHWGGGIELAILASHYRREIAAWNLATGACHVFGEERGEAAAAAAGAGAPTNPI